MVILQRHQGVLDQQFRSQKHQSAQNYQGFKWKVQKEEQYGKPKLA